MNSKRLYSELKKTESNPRPFCAFIGPINPQQLMRWQASIYGP